MKFTSLSIFFTLISSIYGFKVLGVFPFRAKSHFIVGSAIIKSLHEAGHEITVISPFPLKNSIPRYRDISLADYMERNKEGLNNF
jgi:glucuronosyltransferase